MSSSESNNSELANLALQVEKVARGAFEWVGDEANKTRVGQERRGLQRNLRRQAMAAARQAAAAERPMCVGVFGPSQAGKSYLVSILARPGEDPLMARFGTKNVDFIEEINPEGGKESTGLVTRFSIHAQDHPQGYPVCLRLLSESDIIKILANSFFMDGNHADTSLDGDAVLRALEDARSKAGNQVSGLSEDEVFDIQDYVQTQFRSQAQVVALDPLWDEAAELAPRLNIDQRASLFSLVWGGHEPFTSLYRLLARALDDLGHPAEAFCQMSAVIPRETSIIDVATLAGLGRDGGDTLEIRAFDGSSRNFPRAVVTALTAELRIVLPAPPRPFFEHTDLLDFPGARSRQQVAFESFLAKENDGLKELFLRGKVAYLFDRYVAEQELTSMLLCVGDGPQEVVTLPNMIHDWIAKTHGATPAERAGSRTVLFFILTKFDTFFEEKSGAGDDGTRFSARLSASLTDSFGKAHDWPLEWVPDTPFQNCFWLRNPGYKTEAIIDYDGSREVSVREGKVARVEALRSACFATAKVQAHFAEPEAAWDAAMAMNDGGISYLASKLGPVCRPEIKWEQVSARIVEIAAAIHRSLRVFYISDNLEERLNERREAASKVADLLYDAAEHGCFGSLLGLLQIDNHALAKAFVAGESHVDDDIRIVAAVGNGQVGGAATGQGGTTGGIARRKPGSAPPPATTPERSGPRLMTRPQYLAHLTMRHWLEGLYRVASSELVLERLSLPGKVMTNLVQELIAGARRQQLEQELVGRIDRLSFLDRPEVAVNKPAVLAARLINGYVAKLGFDRMPPDQRPQVDEDDGSMRAVFQARPPVDDLGTLAEIRPAFGNIYITDWVFALFRLVEDNAQVKDGIDYDVAQNLRLGELIHALPDPMTS